MSAVSLQSRKAAPDYEVAIIGTGFAGLCMAIRLRQSGQDNFVVFEKAADVGGTWLVNNYPGCACDVQSHLYSYSFEPNPDWSRMFSPQAEIWNYLRRCADKYGVREHVQFRREVTRAEFDEAGGCWRVQLDTGETVTARVLVSGMGGLSRPSYPKIPGLENFRGKTFHSQQWDHDYDLAGKTVAVIGTGASAIQFVPQIAPRVKQLRLFQRTPPWIMPKPDREVTRVERWLFRVLPFTQRLFRRAIYWFLEARVLGFVYSPRIMHLAQRVALRHLQKQIPDPVLRAKVTPGFTFGCKRVLISDDYYPALTRPNVDVVTAGIREVRGHAVVTADGVEHPVDCIIFGTGFHATDPLPRGVFVGRGGVDILDAWKSGAEAYKGTTVAGFPNLFILTGPNTGLGHSSMVFMIESQVRYVMDALRTMQKQCLRAVEVSLEAQSQYNHRVQSRLGQSIWNTGGCSSWYIDPVTGKNVTLWPGFTWQFRLQTRRFDAAAYELTPAMERPSTGTLPEPVGEAA